MSPDITQRIGSVAAVESERITVELDHNSTGLVKAGTAGILPIGMVNSYLTLPAGSSRIVAVVTAIRMVPAAVRAGEDAPEISRTIEASMVGRLEGSSYEPGLTTYPSVFAPVSLATRQDLDVIFKPRGYAFRFGQAVVAPDQDVWLDADRLLGRHFAVLGTTGAGKSCSVMAVVDGLLELDIPSANIVVFDTNGEYARCFDASSPRVSVARALTLGPEPGGESGLVLPQWFMNTDEHLELLRAAEGVQAPLLQRAIADARVASAESGELLHRLRVVRRSLENIKAVERDKKPQEKLLAQFKGLKECLNRYIDSPDELAESWTRMKDSLLTHGGAMSLDKEAWDPLNASQQDEFQRLCESVGNLIVEAIDALGLGSSAAAQDFDAPSHYSFEDLNDLFLPQRIELETQHDARIAAYAATMQMRLARLLADDRYSFLTRVPPFQDALGTYLRLLFGKKPRQGALASTTPWTALYEGSDQDGHAVTLIDLSLVAQDVLSLVTGLIARLILDLAQRLEPRARMPVMVLLEEAHRYVRRDPQSPRTQSAFVFERIAKEGRKFGVSLGLATQRPSELDPTVLSQCGTLIAHRIVGQVDQDIIRAATPLASRDLLRQLPGLATQHAVVLGDAVPAPVAVRVRHVPDPPDSHDPSFVDHWREDNDDVLADVIDRTASAWEAGLRRRIGSPDEAATTDAAQDDGEAPGL